MDNLEQLIGGEGKRVTLEEAQALIKAGGLVYFGNRLCPFAHRSFWLAEETGLTKNWTYVHIDLGKKKPAWYTQINPLGTVPCLFVGGKPVFESLIVAEFINDTQKASFIPADPLAKALVRFIIARFDDTIKGALYATLSNKDSEKAQELANTLNDKLQAFDELYQKSQQGGGPYLLGKEPSLAEIAIFPFLERFETVLQNYRNISLFANGKFPAIAAALTAVRARPAFQKTTAPKDFFIQAYQGYAGGPLTPKPASAAALPKGPLAAGAVVLAAALLVVPLVLAGRKH